MCKWQKKRLTTSQKIFTAYKKICRVKVLNLNYMKTTLLNKSKNLQNYENFKVLIYLAQKRLKLFEISMTFQLHLFQ